MRVEQDRLARLGPRDGDDVAHPRAANAARLVQLVAGELIAHDRFHAHVVQQCQDTIANLIVRRSVGRVGALIAEDERQRHLGTLGVEFVRFRMRAQRGRADQQRLGGHQREERDQNQRKPPRRLAHCFPPPVIY